MSPPEEPRAWHQGRPWESSPGTCRGQQGVQHTQVFSSAPSAGKSPVPSQVPFAHFDIVSMCCNLHFFSHEIRIAPTKTTVVVLVESYFSLAPVA